MKKECFKKNFTLVELLVALGVFSILLILFMQLFTGMRLAWNNTEKNNDISGNARIAMDMLSTLINTTYYSSASLREGAEGRFPFQIDQSTSRPGKMYFATKTTIDLPGTNPIRFVGLQVPNATETFGLSAGSSYNLKTGPFYKLFLTVLANNDSNYPRFCPEFLNSSGDPQSGSEKDENQSALKDLRDSLNGRLSSASQNRIELLRNVTSFTLSAYDREGKQMLEDGVFVYCVPEEIEIKFAVLNDEDFAKWVQLKDGSSVTGDENSAARTFREQKQTVFTRRIHIGERWKTEVGL